MFPGDHSRLRAGHLTLGLLAVLGVGLWLRGHGPTRPQPERLIPTEVAASPEAPWPTERVCTPGDRAPETQPSFELPDVVVPPGAAGPYLREWRHRGRRRDEHSLSNRRPALANALGPCYRFARQRDPELEGTLSGHLLLDEWGRVTAATLAGAPGAVEAARCFEEVLLGRDLSDGEGASTLRLSDVPLTLHLRRSGLRRPHDVPRPQAGAMAAAPPGVCLIRPRQRETDTLAPQELWVDDFDDAQAAEEQAEDWRRELSRWEAAGHKGPRPRLDQIARVGGRRAPEVVPGFAFAWPSILRHLSGRLRYNLGAYRDCFLAAAREERRSLRPPNARILVASFDATGYVHEALDQAEHRDALSRCLEDAVREVWVNGPVSPFSVKVRLLLSDPRLALVSAAPEAAPPRAAVPEVERLAEAALAEGDGPRAERRFSSLLREAPAHPSRCQWHVGLLAAAELREPWGGQRVQQALEALGRHASTAPADPGLAACLGRAAPILFRLLEDQDGALHQRALDLLPG